MTPLYGHTSPETAYLIADYPYGRKLRCQRRVWIEFNESKGYRFVAQTTNPKTGRWNAPHKSTYHDTAMALYLDHEGHVQYSAVGVYTKAADALQFAKTFGPRAECAPRLRAWALQKADFEAKYARGEAYFTINGKRSETSPTRLAEAQQDAAQWCETAELLDPSRLGES